MVTIGIDPGIERIGIGIVDRENQKYKLLFHKLIKTSSSKPQEERLEIIYHELSEILSHYDIKCASIEKLFFSKNVKTAMKVSEARGVILLALRHKQIPINEYTPLQLKQAIIGYGRASKSQIQDFIKLMLGIKDFTFSDDVMDGIALAIIHLNTYKTLSRIKGL